MGALMVQGTSSSAGKSLITAALARSVHRRGLDVVPFKAQNMSNNARVVRGGEIGTAQYLQALAAGVEPNTLMNRSWSSRRATTVVRSSSWESLISSCRGCPGVPEVYCCGLSSIGH